MYQMADFTERLVKKIKALGWLSQKYFHDFEVR